MRRFVVEYVREYARVYIYIYIYIILGINKIWIKQYWSAISIAAIIQRCIQEQRNLFAHISYFLNLNPETVCSNRLFNFSIDILTLERWMVLIKMQCWVSRWYLLWNDIFLSYKIRIWLYLKIHLCKYIIMYFISILTNTYSQYK